MVPCKTAFYTAGIHSARQSSSQKCYDDQREKSIYSILVGARHALHLLKLLSMLVDLPYSRIEIGHDLIGDRTTFLS